MKVERVFTPMVLATRRDAPIAEAAAAMAHFKVGALVVLDERRQGPAGIVTDRDLALQGFASEAGTVGDVMTPVVATVAESADTHEALQLMAAHGVRRLVVVNRAGDARGVLSIDDIVDGLSAELAVAALVLKGELKCDAAGLGEVAVGPG